MNFIKKNNKVEFDRKRKEIEFDLFLSGEFGAMADSQTLLSICDRIHIVLTRKDTLGEVHLVSSHFLEWRQVLCAQANKTNRTLELNGIGMKFISLLRNVSIHSF